MKLRTAAKVVIGLTGYGVWGLFAYYDPAQRADFLRFNIAMAVGTIGLAVRDMQPPGTPAPPQTTVVIPKDVLK